MPENSLLSICQNVGLQFIKLSFKLKPVYCLQGVGGVVQYPKGFLKKAYELVRSNGGVCIADEVTE